MSAIFKNTRDSRRYSDRRKDIWNETKHIFGGDYES